jgi:hypothetical protein
VFGFCGIRSIHHAANFLIHKKILGIDAVYGFLGIKGWEFFKILNIFFKNFIKQGFVTFEKLEDKKIYHKI